MNLARIISKMRLLLLGALLCPAALLSAEELEYRYEVGGMLGGSFYLGDANYTRLFKNMNVMGSALWRYNLNPRMAVKTNLAVARISGDTADNDNKFPNGNTDFARTLYDLAAQFEYNFFAYGEGTSYKHTHRLTPYIFGGLGFTFAPKPADNVFTANIPMGVGVKYKFASRINIGCELSFRFSMSDKLDVTKAIQPILDDPYGIKSDGIKNKDSYAFWGIFLTYDLSPKYRQCNN